MEKIDKLVVLVPTLNEEAGIASVLIGLKENGAGEIVVLDGNSTDKTARIAAGLGAKVLLQEGRGKGNAFITFLKRFPIKDDWKYVMLDGDASYSPDDLGRVSSELGGNDVVSGNRHLLLRTFKDFTHILGGFGISTLGSLLFLRFNPDICTGYWGFRGSALRKMRVTAQGFDLEADLFAEAAKRGLKSVCIPVSYSVRAGESKLTFRDAFKIVGRLVSDRLSA